MANTLLKNATIVTEDSVLKGWDLYIENNKISKIQQKIDSKKMEDVEVIDCNQAIVMPGIIDIHSDMIEGFIQPRSTAVMDFELGFLEAERTLGICGITTMFHSISMYRDGSWDSKMIRQAKQVRKIARMIRDYQEKETLIHHRYHLRYEIDNLSCYDQVKEMLEGREVDLISFMDHSPGQGQYKDLTIYKKHLPNAGKNLSDEEFANLIEREQQKNKVSYEQLKELVEIGKAQGISVASHDDDTIERLLENEKLGVAISEFPITLEVAKKARELGQQTVLGAPNVLLGGSHSGNLSATRAIQENAGSILVSDYYPQSLLQAVFLLYREGIMALEDAVSLVTLNPARATGIDKETGSIKEGKRADLLVVTQKNGLPFIQQVFVDGSCIIACKLRGN